MSVTKLELAELKERVERIDVSDYAPLDELSRLKEDLQALAAFVLAIAEPPADLPGNLQYTRSNVTPIGRVFTTLSHGQQVAAVRAMQFSMIKYGHLFNKTSGMKDTCMLCGVTQQQAILGTSCPVLK